jgi:signal recognition particle GTPase
VIEDGDLDGVLLQIKEQLMSKNVAEEIAASLIQALRS